MISLQPHSSFNQEMVISSLPDHEESFESIRNAIYSGSFEETFKQVIWQIARNNPDKEKQIQNFLLKFRTFLGGSTSLDFRHFLWLADRMQQWYDLQDCPKLKDFYFVQDISRLKTMNLTRFTCPKKITIFNRVCEDGFGDFAIAQSMIKAYFKNCDCHIECKVFSSPEHLAKMQRIFSQSIQEINRLNTLRNNELGREGNSLSIQWIDEVFLREHADESENDPSRITISASTGWWLTEHAIFSPESSIDSLDEMGADHLTGMDINHYTSESLALKLGFSSTSAGVLLPEKATDPLETALASSNCLSRIQSNIDNPDAPFSEILQKNDITILYMSNQIPEKRYLKFMGRYTQETGKPIHIIVPTGDEFKLEVRQYKPYPNVILYYTPFFPTKDFQTIVQKATLPPGITGNDTFLNAVVGETPFFFEGRETMKYINSEFIEFCTKQGVHEETAKYLENICSMADSYSSIEDEEIEAMVLRVISFGQEIREDLRKIHHQIRNTCNAEILICNRLQERSK